MHRRLSRRVRLWSILAVAVLAAAPVLALLPGSLPSLGAARGGTSAAGGTAPSGPAASPGAALVSAAQVSLAHGAGPAAGQRWTCATPSSLQLKCALPSGPVPRVPHGNGAPPIAGTPQAGEIPSTSTAISVSPAADTALAWYNQTSYVNGYGEGPVTYLAAAAYDPDISGVVLFGGCSWACPTNATWIYSGGVWVNETQNISGYVPALDGEALVWDPTFDGLIMAGGEDAAGSDTNWTFLFFDNDWLNVTDYVPGDFAWGSLGYGDAYSAAAYDDAIHAVVLVDGCAAGCGIDWSGTWILNGTGWYGLAGPPLGANLRFSYGGSVAYDAFDDYLVYFGGVNSSGTLVNSTYIFDGTGWTNITGPGLCSYGCPSGRAFASMTWDGQWDAIVLTGGIGYAGGDNDTWYYDGLFWFEFTGLPSPGYHALYGAAMPSNSTDIAPALFGGYCGLGWCFNDTQVFDLPPYSHIYAVVPSPTDVGVAVNISAAKFYADGSGPTIGYYFYDSSYDNVFVGEATGLSLYSNVSVQENFVFPAAGTYGIYYELIDFFGVWDYSYASVVVNASLSIAPSAAPGPTEVGVPTTFSANAADGSPPLTYLWGFGDGTPTSTLASPSHTYSTAGSYTAWANVTDGLGASENLSFAVVVEPALSVTAAPSYAVLDLGMAVTFTATPSDGVGPYGSYAWTYGDGNGSSATTPTFTYGHPGTYTVGLSLEDSLGVSASTTTSLTVHPVPTVSSTASTSSPSTSTSVSFTATVTGGTGPFTYAWDFGDGATGTGATPSHQFSTAGTYTVTVTITDAVGVHASHALTVTASKPSSTSPLGGLTSGTGLYALIAAVVIVLALLAVLLMRRRKGPATPASPPPTGSSGAPGAAQGAGMGEAPPPSPPSGAS